MIGMIVLLTPGLCAVAQGQWDTAAVRFRDSRDSLPEVTIKGYRDPGGVRQAIRLRRAASLIVDILPEEAIQRTPDLTVADVTRRVNGLSATTDQSGQADLTIIRGMDPKYNYTLVNRIKIPSPGDRSRYVSLSLFPADLVQRVEVYKNLDPSMEGDAIGGVVNMVLRNAPEKPLLKVRLATGYNQTFFDQSYLSFDRHVIRQRSPYELHGPGYQATGSDFSKANLSFRNVRPVPDGLGSVTWGRRFAGSRLGVLLAADYQNVKRGVPDDFIPQNNEPQLGNAPGLTDFYHNQYSATLIREGLHSRMDYVIDARNSIDLYQFYAGEQDIESRYRVDTGLSQGRTEPGTGRITISDRSREHLQHIYSGTLQGDHWLIAGHAEAGGAPKAEGRGRPGGLPGTGSGAGSLRLRWTSAWSVATGLYPDWAELSAGTARIEQPNGAIVQSPLLLDPLTRSWLRNRERDWSNYLYLDYRLPVGNHLLALGAGGLFREKERTNFYNSYVFQPAITGTEGQIFTNIYDAQWTNGNGPTNPLGAVNNPNTYTAQEYIGAGYLSLQWKGRRAEWMTGLRYEHTTQSFVSAVDPTVSYGKEGSIRYFDFLPSAQLKYRLNDRQVLRASWFRSLSRPALYDVTFYSIQYEDYVEAGNPFLRRARADNADLRWEWYGRPASGGGAGGGAGGEAPGGDQDVVQAGVFYKHIADPYERTLLDAGDELYPIPQQGLAYTPAGELTAQMRNAADANDLGAEIAATKYLGRFGIQAQYTYTYSRLVQPTKYQTRTNPSDPTSNIITVTRDESRPLQGQSPHLASLSLLYADAHKGWNMRVGGIYTGRRIYSVSGWYSLDYWQRSYTVLDASVEKTLGHGWKVFVKADNLFNTHITVDLLKPNPDFASGLVPGQQRADRFTVMQQTDRAVYFAGVQWGWR
jgi:outer membrane receptor protein involved in Fe transport